jgi:hypothetical protein
LTDRRARTSILDAARLECERRLTAGDSLRAVETYIDAVPISRDARASLWLWAWGLWEQLDPARPGARIR